MSRKLFLIVTLSWLNIVTLGSMQAVKAETPLTRATVQALRNQVQLIFKNRVTRAARNADTMTPGDSLATARKSFAELRFNDSSLARIGERALFQFVPNTRNFYLGNGTALLLIPPGQGRTNVRTPNAAAGIRGSALFIRYNEDTDTTIVGALTNSRIEVSNGETTQAQTLQAGQMAVIVQNQVVQVYNFDLKTFYQTSELVKDLDLPLSNATPNADPGIAAVQAETSQAAREQVPLTGRVSENPAFVSLTPPPGVQATVTPGLLGTTPIPSGLDLSAAQQSIAPTASTAPTAPQAPSPDSQPSPPDTRPVTPDGPTLPNPAPAPPSGRTPAPNPGTPGQVITLPGTPRPAPAPGVVTTPAPTQTVLVTPAPAPVVTAPAPAPAPGVVTAPAPVVTAPTPAPTVLVTPAPTPVVTAPAPAPTVLVTPAPAPVVTAPAPAPTVLVTPAPVPVVTAPTPAPTVLVTPAPAPTVPVAPTPAPVVTAPAPTVLVTPAPTPTVPVAPAPAPVITTPAPATSPAPRPAPAILTPAPASSVQVTPTSSTGATTAPSVQVLPTTTP